MSIADRLRELDILLPTPPQPVASYVPAVRTGNLLFVSGQLPFSGKSVLAVGPIPSVVHLEHAQTAAQQCVLNILAIVNHELGGDLERVTRVVRIGVFVQCDARFKEQSLVANGASDLLVKIFGDRGKHARAAVGVPALPLDATVEVEAMFEIREP